MTFLCDQPHPCNRPNRVRSGFDEPVFRRQSKSQKRHFDSAYDDGLLSSVSDIPVILGWTRSNEERTEDRQGLVLSMRTGNLLMGGA